MNILLVDDDYFVITALEKKIDWKALSIENIYTAYNVAQAREILLQHPVQIVICDIEMPQGSGLELLAWIREEHYSVQAIILTNYADFNYAQKAIELQSFDYFLKPIEFDKLTLIIQKAVAKAKEQQSNERAIHEGHLWQKNRKTLLEDFWRRLILGKDFPSSPSSFAAFVEQQNLPYQAEDRFLPVLVNLFPYDKCLGDDDKSLFDYALLNVMYELFQDSGFSVEAITEFKEYNWMVILKWNHAPDPRIIERICASFIGQAGKYLKCDASCNIAESRTLEHIRKAIKDLLKLNDEMIKHRNRIFWLEQYHRPEAVYSPPDLSLLEQLLNENAYDAFLKETGDYLHKLNQGQVLNMSLLSLLRLDIAQLVYAHLKSKEIEAHKLYTGRTGDQLFVQSLNSIEDMQKYIGYLVSTAADYRQFTEQPKSVVHEIKHYIHTHCGDDLSRMSLAETVYLNPDYLARLFKKETGISLGNYIIQARISAAKHLLETTQLSVYAIASKVGYANYSHFSKLFKQEAGCSPNEYRKSRKEMAPVPPV
ncbi:helix-turn-helix domain-containing protein [Paenibacillus sabinae]|uniref:Two component AraC family transcriptional regulator n=1 Tax=Paenibacillus sabinae T27 TaxID=1268072 RepID=X4ZKJ4_9BACL|nr:helix-turn-helix domain-containing protein [Paenibacillus sabinae]AHV97230.1 two component AraC family transcriptional regulator [Paenibacillus sabinae T27]